MKTQELYNKAIDLANRILFIHYGIGWDDLKDSNDMMDYISDFDYHNSTSLKQHSYMDELLNNVMDAVIDRIEHQHQLTPGDFANKIYEKPYIREYLKQKHILN